jgi:glucose/mannose-6-phosphate isomerase
MNLDDTSAIRKVDQSDMLSAMEKAPERLAPPPDADSTCQIDLPNPMNVVFGGVGGSGIVGELLTDYCRDSLQTPTLVCRSVSVPSFVGKNTLFVAISYSGETGETLGMFERAKAKGASLAAVCSGGKLLSMSKAEGIPYVEVAGGTLPRLALPELLGAVTHVLGAANIVNDNRRVLDEAARSVREQISRVKVSVPSQQNKAKQIAKSLADRLPILVGSEENTSVLRRFKNELNENSKVPAFYYTLPEAYHDDVEGLKVLSQLSRPQPILLRNQHQTEGEERTSRRLVELFSQVGFPPALYFDGVGDGRLGWLVSAIMFGDYVSVYLSALRGVDPSQLFLIPNFRAIRGQV